MRWISMLIVMVAIAAACHSDGGPTAPVDAGEPIACQDPRPEICTRDYRPVCGARDTGIRCVTTPCNSTEPRTYGNACTACSDEKVLSYVEGECGDTKAPQGDDDAPRDSIR